MPDADDDIRDLLGRYATGSVTEQERQRLFHAALDNQEIFEELARELQMKQLFDEPGARNRIIRALEPPRNKTAWILGIAATAALSVVLIVFLMRPVPKPPQLAVIEKAPAPPTVITSTTQLTTKSKVATPVLRTRKKADVQVPEPKQIDPKQTDQIAAAQQPAAASSAGTVRQLQLSKAVPGAMRPAAFGFHYSVETKGHLIITPLASGYLSVKSNDGASLFDLKPAASGIPVDIPLPDAATLVTITFSLDAAPVEITPTVRTAPDDTIRSATALAIELKINP